MVFRVGSGKSGSRRSVRTRVVRLILLTVTLSAGFLTASHAQIRGVPASVTSPTFGGEPGRINGTPPSVTSLGPNGFGHHSNFRIEAGFSLPPNRNMFPPHPHGPRFPFYSYGYYSYVPYYLVPYPIDSHADDSSQNNEDEYKGGPTIFDRRGPGTPARNYHDDYRERRQDSVADTKPVAVPERTAIADEPPTVLVFKDGHQLEIANYAIVGTILYDLGKGPRRKIALADLDLAATTKQNDDRGIDFQVPATAVQN